MNYKINESIEFLQQHFYNKKALVCTSGGKDSIVINKLVELAKIDFEMQSTLTGIDPPEVTRFIRKNYPLCRFVRPRMSFWYLLTTHNPPGGTGRGIKWCCTKIKEDPSRKNPIKNRILGIRSEESHKRAKYGMINYIEKHNQTHFHPIFNWLEWEVWEFIEMFKLPYPSLYDQGFSRIGCVICPNHSKHHDIYRRHYPKYFACFEKYVQIWYEKRKSQGRNMYHETVQDFLVDWYNGKFYYYQH